MIKTFLSVFVFKVALALFSTLDSHQRYVYADDNSVIATTSILLSICGDGLVDSTEQCDVPGQTGGYSTTILGRQCTPVCKFDPYCGDGILQTIYSETCDDGNNVSGDFCTALCKVEPLAGGGGPLLFRSLAASPGLGLSRA